MFSKSISGLGISASASEHRYMFVQDYDAHWYCIPVLEKEKFNNWLNKLEYEGDPDLYDHYRLPMHPSNYSFAVLMEEV